MPVRGRVRPASVAGAAVVAATAALVAVRQAHLDRAGVLVAALAGAPWVWAPAALVLAALVARGLGGGRRPVTAALPTAALLTAAVLALPAWWAAGQFDPWRSASPAPAGAPTLRVFDANVTWYNDRAPGIAAAVGDDHPDLVTLEEVTPPLVAALDATAAFRRLRYRLLDPQWRSTGMAVWSDRPLRDASVWSDAGHPELRARLRVGPAMTTVLAVHTFIPVLLPEREWRAELAGIASVAGRLRGPRIVVGDFNATWDMWELQAILRRGRLSDAAVDTGHGGSFTWRPEPGWPAVITIDHLLVSAQLAVQRYRVGPDPGAQHRSLEVTVALRPSG